MSSDKNHEKLDVKLDTAAEMLIAQYKGKALSKAIKTGVRDCAIFSRLLENQNVRRTLSNVLAQNIKNAEIISKLHSAGADVRFDNDALLVYAANEGATDTVNVLIEAGAKPNARALTVAIANRHVDVLKILVDVNNVALPEKTWKIIFDPLREGYELDLELIRIISPLAKDEQLFEAYKKCREAKCYDAAEIICESLIFGNSRSQKVQHSLMKDLCITSGVGDSKQLVSVLKDLLHQGIQPNEKELAQINEAGDKTIIRLVKRYMQS
jgi:hypothetical protein